MGELEKRLKDFAAAHTRVKGKLIRRDDYIDLVLDEAEKEVPVKDLGVFLNHWEYLHEKEIAEWFIKWFGKQ